MSADAGNHEGRFVGSLAQRSSTLEHGVGAFCRRPTSTGPTASTAPAWSSSQRRCNRSCRMFALLLLLLLLAAWLQLLRRG